jgi:hypothetical protein
MSAIGRLRIGLDKQVIVEPGDCSSACAYTFLGGVKRSVREQDRIGVHQFSFVDKGAPQPSSGNIQILFAKLVRYVGDMGANTQRARSFSTCWRCSGTTDEWCREGRGSR